MSSGQVQIERPSVFGHPAGLFTLFFAEMWERFSYYGMRALLVFYMINGFLTYADNTAYAVYGFYTALVYMTPFFGGMIADKLLGSRRAVILGGLLMAAGHLMMTIENDWAFFTALALLIAGNGFFKPNISTIVGSLYPQGSVKRDGGFTIFYMGINLGAAMSPLLCGYIGQTYGWHYGFGLATIGMVLGVAIFVAPSLISQVTLFLVSVFATLNIFVVPQLINNNSPLLSFFPPGAPIQNYFNMALMGMLCLAGVISFLELNRSSLQDSLLSKVFAIVIMLAGAFAAALGLIIYRPSNLFSISVNVIVAVALVMAGIVALVAIIRGGLPKEAGAPPNPAFLRRPLIGPLSIEWIVYAAALLAIPIFVLFVSGLAPLTSDRQPITLIPSSVIDSVQIEVLRVALDLSSTLAGAVLILTGIGALAYLIWETVRLDKIARERMMVVLILTFFSMLFWAFFEQAGSSVNLFTDRNVDRVFEQKSISKDDVQTTFNFRIALDTDDSKLAKLSVLTQEQLGQAYGNDAVKTQIADAIRGEETRKADQEGKSPDEKTIKGLIAAATKKNELTMTGLTYLREANKNRSYYEEKNKQNGSVKVPPETLAWQVMETNVGMGIGGSEVPASVFQALNPMYILVFGIIFSLLWTVLGRAGLEPSTPIKFSLGLLQLGLGFGAFWYGALNASNGMVGMTWLFVGYLLHTTGELCLSPVGLSMVTKLSPARLVSTVMGMWFLATAFSQFLAAIIAQFTGVGHGSGGAAVGIPVPAETVDLYGGVFGKIAITAIISAGICLLLSPLLSYWMHSKVKTDDDEPLSVLPTGGSTKEQSEHIQAPKDQIQEYEDRFREARDDEPETGIQDKES